MGLLYVRDCHRLPDTLSTWKRQGRSLPFSASLTCSPVEPHSMVFPIPALSIPSHTSLDSCPRCSTLSIYFASHAHVWSHEGCVLAPPSPHLCRPPVPSAPNVIYYQSNQLHLRDKLQPSPSSCFFNLRWRHLETSLIKWLTGS